MKRSEVEGRPMTERSIFLTALEKETPEERAAYLDEACAGKPELRRQVEILHALIDKYTPGHLRLISAMRRSLRKRLPTAHEVVYEYLNLGAVVISFSPNEPGRSRGPRHAGGSLAGHRHRAGHFVLVCAG
jgi:hypothetical protein